LKYPVAQSERRVASIYNAQTEDLATHAKPTDRSHHLQATLLRTMLALQQPSARVIRDKSEPKLASHYLRVPMSSREKIVYLPHVGR
jgi:hypothetical protein